jgi:hypothetical protein
MNVSPEDLNKGDTIMKTQEAKTAKKASKKTTKPITKVAKTKQTAKATKPAKTPRSDSKKEIVLSLLRREHGATLAEIAKATDWQNHSIRGFVSGQVTKKMGMKVESTKSEAGERIYRILA